MVSAKKKTVFTDMPIKTKVEIMSHANTTNEDFADL